MSTPHGTQDSIYTIVDKGVGKGVCKGVVCAASISYSLSHYIPSLGLIS